MSTCGWILTGMRGKTEHVTRLRSLRCPCGFEVRSRSEEEIVAMAQLHARSQHGQEITAEQARALIEPVADQIVSI